MAQWPFEADCVRPGCGHSSSVHSLDDALNLGPCDPAATFRCQVCGVARCPDMVRSPENLVALRRRRGPSGSAPDAGGSTGEENHDSVD